MTEDDMLLSLKNGNTEALGELIYRYTPYISAVIGKIIGGKSEDCRELTADVFFAAWENREKLKSGKIKSYLAEIARNRAFNFIRSSKSFLPLDEDIIFTGESPQERAENRELSNKLKKALSQLDKNKKELFLRYYYYGQKIREAASDMGVKLSTAKVWLKRGRDELQKTLIKEGIEL
jgi:RNA polymerase sigma-70 factor (ECF subfamily)